MPDMWAQSLGLNKTFSVFSSPHLNLTVLRHRITVHWGLDPHILSVQTGGEVIGPIR